MVAATLPAQFERAKGTVVGATSLTWRTGEVYKGPVSPSGIVSRETVGPDLPDRGQTRHYLVIAEHLPPQLWPYDGSSFPIGTEALVLASLDDKFDLVGWDEASRALDGLTCDTCPGGTMETLSAINERSRNYRFRILFNISRSAEEQEDALVAARQQVRNAALPDVLQAYVDTLNSTDSQPEFRDAAFGIWEHQALAREHIEQLGSALILPATSGKDVVAQLWMCAKLCELGCRDNLAPYAVLLAHSFSTMKSSGDDRRTLQYGLLSGLMSARPRLPRDVARGLVDALDSELQLNDPYHWFVVHCIYLLGAIGDPSTEGSLLLLKERYPVEVAAALDGFGKATVGEIAERARPTPKAPVPEASGCFIATAVYGSDRADEVMLLRTFRDETLRATPAGMVLIRLYEALSPPLAAILTRHRFARCLVRRFVLTPLVMGLRFSRSTRPFA